MVATGEGADELFWGYDLFKEVALRELSARDPERAAALLDGLYAYLGPRGAAPRAGLAAVPARDRAPTTTRSAPT